MNYKSWFVSVLLLVALSASSAWADGEGNGHGDGTVDQQGQTHRRDKPKWWQWARKWRERPRPQQQQQQQGPGPLEIRRRKREAKVGREACVKLALSLNWSEKTAQYVCQDATTRGGRNSLAPVQCVVYWQNHPDWSHDQVDWPEIAELCRGAKSASYPIDCALEELGKGRSWESVRWICSWPGYLRD